METPAARMVRGEDPIRRHVQRALRERMTDNRPHTEILTALLNGEIFYTLKEAQIVIENWRRHYNTTRPHSSLGYRPPAPAALVWPAPKEIVKMQSLN